MTINDDTRTSWYASGLFGRFAAAARRLSAETVRVTPCISLGAATALERASYELKEAVTQQAIPSGGQSCAQR
jgi:hypothetical protein